MRADYIRTLEKEIFTLYSRLSKKSNNNLKDEYFHKLKVFLKKMIVQQIKDYKILKTKFKKNKIRVKNCGLVNNDAYDRLNILIEAIQYHLKNTVTKEFLKADTAGMDSYTMLSKDDMYNKMFVFKYHMYTQHKNAKLLVMTKGNNHRTLTNIVAHYNIVNNKNIEIINNIIVYLKNLSKLLDEMEKTHKSKNSYRDYERVVNVSQCSGKVYADMDYIYTVTTFAKDILTTK